MPDASQSTPPRLSPTEALILELLIERGPLYGLELVAQSDGALRRGSVYVVLARMQDKGYVESVRRETPASGGLPRPIYRATALGARALEVRRVAARAWLPPAEET